MDRRRGPFRSRPIGGASKEPVSQSAREMADNLIDALVAGHAGQQLGLSEPQRAFLLDYAVLVLQDRLSYYFLRVVDEGLETEIGQMEEKFGPTLNFEPEDLVVFARALSARTPRIEEVSRWTGIFQKLREPKTDCLVAA